MRKFKVIKKWIGGPEVGTTLNEYSISTTPGELGTDDNPMFHEDGKMAFYFLNQIKGFAEEMKEPEEFWYIDLSGKVTVSTIFNRFGDDYEPIPNWLRFKTKEACEKFRDGLIATYGAHTILGSGTTPNVYCLVNSLNQRVTK